MHDFEKDKRKEDYQELIIQFQKKLGLKGLTTFLDLLNLKQENLSVGQSRFIIDPNIILDFILERNNFKLLSIIIEYLVRTASGFIASSSLPYIYSSLKKHKPELIQCLPDVLDKFIMWKIPSYVDLNHPLAKKNINKYMLHISAESLDGFILTDDKELESMSDRSIAINEFLNLTITSKQKRIPFIDLKRQNIRLFPKVERKLDDIVVKSQFICGKYVHEFEKKFASYLGAKHCIGVNSGTSALIVALMAIGLKPGDEVIMPVNTFIATAEAVSILGGKPVFVDVHPDYYTIDVSQIEGEITDRTKAIIPVHLYGQCADMDPIMEIAKKYSLWVIEDACQAHGAEYKGRKAGTIGHIGCFSFYPGKNLGAWGEAGACVTSDDILAEKMYKIRNHGGIKKYQHDILGGNFRMEEIQGAVLSEKINYLDEWNERRRKVAKMYNKILKDLECKRFIKLPKEAPYNKHVYHLFVIQINNVERNKVISELKNYGIDVGIHYPSPLHKVSVYYEDKSYPVAEKIQSKIISLPIYENIQEKDIYFVKNQIESMFNKHD